MAELYLIGEPMEEEIINEYKKAFPNTNLTIFQQELLAYEVQDLEAWKETIRFWAGNAYRGESVFKMIDYYKGVINGKHSRDGANGKNTTALRESQDYFASKYGS